MKAFVRMNILGLALLVVAISGCAGKKTAGTSGVNGTDSGTDSSMGDSSGSDSSMGSGGSASMVNGLNVTPVYFDYDQAALSSEARATLKTYYQAWSKTSKATVLVEGHCDSRGTSEYNLALGERRAKAVKDYLVNLGLSASRVSTVSYGEERPALSGENESAWAKNRRGEFVVSNK